MTPITDPRRLLTYQPALDPLAPLIQPYRYAQRTVVAQMASSGSGFKTRAMRLADHVGGRWVGRAGGYIMSQRQADRLLQLYAEGYDSSPILRNLIPPTRGV